MVFGANRAGVKELRGMADVFEEVLEEYGFTAKREARGREEGREEDVNKLQKHGMDPGQIAEVLELPLHRVFKYLSIDSARH
jgi:predicted transposase YdaD